MTRLDTEQRARLGLLMRFVTERGVAERERGVAERALKTIESADDE